MYPFTTESKPKMAVIKSSIVLVKDSTLSNIIFNGMGLFSAHLNP